MDGLKRAADSREYSARKYDPINCCLSSDKRRINRQGLAKLLEAFQEDFADLQVAKAEFSADFVKEPADLVFRYCHDSGNDSGNPLGAARSEGPQQNAGLVGMQKCGCAVELNGHYIWAAIPRLRSVP